MQIVAQIHSILRWLVLIVAIYAIVKSLIGMMNKSSFTESDNKAGLFLTIVCDMQLLIGLVLYFVGEKGFKLIQANGMAETMKNSYMRFFAVEHISMMLLAIILIHIGRSKTKKAFKDSSKHSAAFWFYLIGLILILSSIPWPFRPGFEGLNWM
jgi:hypothetical protein